MPDTIVPDTMTMSSEGTGRPVRAEIQGLVDSATDFLIAGWARNLAQSEERLRIELRIEDVVVASDIANRERPDLVKAGVGDGRHAFELPLKPEWARQHAEMTIVACAADGVQMVLPMRIRRADIDPNGNLQRALEATATMHRQILEEVRTVGRRAEAIDTERNEVVAKLSDRVETLSLWLTRLDGNLAALARQAPTQDTRRRTDPWQWVLVAILAALLLAAAFGTASLVRG